MYEFTLWLQQLLGDAPAPFMLWVTDWLGPVGWLIAFGVFEVLAGIRRGLPLAFLLIFSLLLNTWLKWLWLAPRPYFVSGEVVAYRATPGFGMPSGHAQGAFALWGGIGWLLRQRLGWCIVLFVLAALVALTRVYLGVHSLAQILAGSVLGILGIFLMAKLTPILSRRFAAWSDGRLLGLLLIVALVAAVLNTVVLAWAQGFQVPELWLQRFGEAQGQAPVTADALSLFSNGTPILLGLMVGYGVMGLFDRRFPAVLVTLRGKALALLLAVLSHLAFVVGVGALGEAGLTQTLLEGIWVALAVLQPILCLYLPMRISALSFEQAH